MDRATILLIAGIAALVIIGIVIAVVATGLSSRCPACRKWWSMKEADRKEISREPGMKWVTRTETQHDAKGQASQVQRQVQVHIMRIKFDGLFRCNKCAHEYRKEFIEEKETW